VTAADTRPVPPVAVRARDVFVSEWTKFRSLRSTFWTLLIAVVTALGGSVIVAISDASAPHSTPLDPVTSIFASWLEYPVLSVGILGVLTFTAEYSSGQIRMTFTAVPRRLAVLAAKAGVAGLVTLVCGELLAWLAFALTKAIVSGHHAATALASPGVTDGVLAGGFSLCVITLLGIALGAIIRHTGGAVAALPAVIYLPLVFLTLPSPWKYEISKFMLLPAAYQTIALHPSAHLLSPPVSLLVLIAWPALALLAAAILLPRRDA
jgi:ABC-2 type transport system permease protein